MLALRKSYDGKLLPNSYAVSPEGKIQFCCPQGHVSKISLNDDEIDVDGYLNKKVSCDTKGCTFKDEVRLEDY